MNRTNSVCNAKICPTIGVLPSSSIRACLGASLAQAFFQYTHDDTKKLLDVLTPPKISKDCFSISSEDDSRGTAYTPPTDFQVVKAFVHQNILEIGEEILKRVEKEIEENLRARIQKEAHEKFHMYQAKKRREAQEHVQRLHLNYKNYLSCVQKQLQRQLENEWANVTAEHKKDIQKAVVQERINVVREMMQKMRTEISHVVLILYKDFEDTFRAQRETIIADFNHIMREKHVQLNKNMQEFQSKLRKELYIQRHQLEMQNATDIIYLLCLERLRSDREKHTIHKFFEKQINAICELVARLQDIMGVMREEIVNCHLEKKSLEDQLCQITTHFQRFIDFVFHAAPGQAQYVLPLELQRLITLDKNEET
ncbi:uncharacterized protein LOC143265895 [Megachile rotundata]|uniref:uncharacterized protein LOC143265895 n=1 Tax=Megachile rotundata TaxID=143995 RepID=UPI003FD2664C